MSNDSVAVSLMSAPYIVVQEYSVLTISTTRYRMQCPASSEATPTSILYVQMAVTNHTRMVVFDRDEQMFVS